MIKRDLPGLTIEGIKLISKITIQSLQKNGREYFRNKRKIKKVGVLTAPFKKRTGEELRFPRVSKVPAVKAELSRFTLRKKSAKEKKSIRNKIPLATNNTLGEVHIFGGMKLGVEKKKLRNKSQESAKKKDIPSAVKRFGLNSK